MNRHTYRIAALVASGLAATLLLHACGGYSSPTNPYPSPQPAGAPAPSPTPSPTPTPAPTPTPDATPAPAPTPTPAPAPTPTPTPSLTTVIEILGENGNMSFAPASASLQVGQQVRWHNADTTVHTATQDGGGLDTGFLLPGATSAPVALTAAATLRYHCSVHPSMVGALNVTR